MIIMRHTPRRSAPSSKPRKSKGDRLHELREAGWLEVVRLDPQIGDGVIIRFGGALAKLPSTTNHRMITVPRTGVVNQLQMLMDSPYLCTRATLYKLMCEVRKLRGFITKNPEQQTLLQVMTEKLCEKPRYRPAIDKDNRGLVLMLLGSACDRSDSHNMPKAMCDWMEKTKLVENDRHVDAFARRKKDLGIIEECSDVLLLGARAKSLYIEELFVLMRSVFGNQESFI